MRAVIIIFVLLAVLAGAWFAASKGIIPVKQMVAQNPKMRPVLSALHLVPATAPKLPTLKLASSKPVKQKVSVEAAPEVVSPVQAPPVVTSAVLAPPPAIPASEVTLQAIYATMDPGDIARIAAKQTDTEVINILSSLDEKKAGSVMAALPVDRAARIAHVMATGEASPEKIASSRHHPATSIP